MMPTMSSAERNVLVKYEFSAIVSKIDQVGSALFSFLTKAGLGHTMEHRSSVTLLNLTKKM